MLGAIVRSTASCRPCARLLYHPAIARSIHVVASMRFPLTSTARMKSYQQAAGFRSSAALAKEVSVTFIESDGNEVQATGEEGTNLMELAHENDVDLEGACEGACACSTCHVILDDKIFDDLPEPTDEENDMLDLAFGLTDTSRLGCQVLLTPEMEGMRIKLPSATRNFYVDGAKPAHH
ncbi:Adrenodoxin-like protein 2, mitochondrial [Coemansia sp. RSA 1822]|nr:Adrenodoxin-like protein 2, mitochondrial [Coemansia sp. RSA 638]KAJ2538243.1 Adrenodoxin-like protein 2, mitochondrial [Coemansia sp. RSA 1853]KAJ2565065.1 Adrenodoxin-like protein 2, mitochondrial [Coemansia sp. RSA 1822]